MSLFDIFRKSASPAPQNSVQDVPGLRGPVTSRQAAEHVRAAAAAITKESMLVQVLSGPSILHDGRSHTWEFMLRLADLKCSAIFALEGKDRDAEPDTPAMQLKRTFAPLTHDAATRPVRPIPWTFADSTQVVAALTRAGADFVAGPTDMGIRSDLDESGQLVWKTDYYGKTLQVADRDV